MATGAVFGRNPARRPARAPARADRYSRRVDRLRFWLPVTAGLLLAMVILWPRFMGGYSDFIMPVFGFGGIEAADVMRMQAPRYSGQTVDQDTYEISAESAYLDPAATNRIRLDRITADLLGKADRDTHLTAANGLYLRDRDELELGGGIIVTTSDGYKFTTETAQIDLQRSHVVGERPIRGAGPAGNLAADQFEIRQGGDVLQFQGRVKVIVQPRSTGDRPS